MPQQLGHLELVRKERDQAADLWPPLALILFLPPAPTTACLRWLSVEGRAQSKPSLGQSCRPQGLRPFASFSGPRVCEPGGHLCLAHWGILTMLIC